jgi:hypothetical protein
MFPSPSRKETIVVRRSRGTLQIVTALVLAALGRPSMAQIREGAWTPAVESMDRGYSSISYWTYRDDGVEIGGGRISVEHGKPSWPPELDAKESFDSATLGRLWRLGNNKWTTLDSNLVLEFGDRRIEPGIYYLVLERANADSWRLVFVAPDAARAMLGDAWDTQARPREVPVLFSVPLRYATGAPKQELDVTLSLSDSDMSAGRMRIEWGPHALETDFHVELVSPTFYKTKR